MATFHHKKSLGQNFLTDEKVLENIVANLDIEEKDLIIEIGPGQGALTSRLKKFNANLLCFEIDERTRDYLFQYEDEKTKVIYGDFLNTDVLKEISQINYGNLYVIANLPYYITTPIIEKLISLNLDIKEMRIMVQKEVGERFSAIPGTKKYSSITVFLNYYFDIKKLIDVNKNSFNPIPKVDSVVLSFTKRKSHLKVNDESHFFKLIKDAFKFKRKNIKNNLGSYNMEIIAKVLNEYDMDLNVRSENISIEIFALLSNALIEEK